MKRRSAVEKWKLANYDYYLAQKRRCAHKPSYLSHRREVYRRSKKRLVDLSTRENNNDDNSKSNEGPADGVHCPRHAAPSPEERHWTVLA